MRQMKNKILSYLLAFVMIFSVMSHSFIENVHAAPLGYDQADLTGSIVGVAGKEIEPADVVYELKFEGHWTDAYVQTLESAKKSPELANMIAEEVFMSGYPEGLDVTIASYTESTITFRFYGTPVRAESGTLTINLGKGILVSEVWEHPPVVGNQYNASHATWNIAADFTKAPMGLKGGEGYIHYVTNAMEYTTTPEDDKSWIKVDNIEYDKNFELYGVKVEPNTYYVRYSASNDSPASDYVSVTTKQDHVHEYSNEYSKDDGCHWFSCTCKIKKGYEEHKIPETPTITVEPQCGVDGAGYYECLTCHYKEEVVIEGPSHDFTDARLFDENTHWIQCTRCNAKSLEEEHTLSGWQIDYNATCQNDGQRSKECLNQFCDYVLTEPIPITGHNFNGPWLKDETQHWKQCDGCNATDKLGIHNFTSWKDTSEDWNCSTGRDQERVCQDCGYRESRNITGNHSYKYNFDETQHWYECEGCEDKNTYQAHDLDTTETIQAATCEAPGIGIKKCRCGYSEEFEIPTSGHVYSQGLVGDENGHAYVCKCGNKKDFQDHSFKSWRKVSDSTCSVVGKEERTCSVCFYVEERDLPLEDHVLKDGYENDARVHWNACENCNEKIDLATHNWEYGEIISESTCTEAGKQARHCSVCGHEDTVDLELADHEYGDEFFYDENEHYKKCSCGDKTAVSQHEDNEWNTVVEGDCETDTILERTCSCGYREEKTIKADGHQYEGQQFEYDVNSHWRECAICGTSEDESSHKFSDWNIINNATCQEEGLKERTCDCGYTETETISIGEHKYIIPNWDEAEHWMECECGDIETKTVHSLSDWITVSQPTCGSDGLSIKQCSGCEYILEQYTKKENHDFEGEWKYNDTQHWYECQCGEPGEKSNHEMSEWETINHANCQTEGLEKRVCRTCPYFEEKVIDKTECDFSGDYAINDGLHWKKCECGKIAFEEEHYFEQVEIIEESSCCKNGKELVKCAICEFQTERELPLKEHEKSNELASDDNGHWFKCATENCEEQIELTAHLFEQEKVNSDNVAEDATCVSPAKYYKACICGKYGKETFESGEKLDHTMSNEWSHDDKNHYYECTFDRCDYKENIEKHELSFLKELKDATCTVIGEELYKCGVCDAEITILTDYAAHIWETEITKDETSHWYECSNEDCNDKKDVVKHEFSQQVVAPEFLEKAATCVKKATYFKSCICGAKGTETFEHGELSTEHDIEDKLYYDETNHFKKCSVEGCNYVSESEQHIFDKEVVTEEFEASKATCQAKAKYYKSCVCGKAGTEKFESGEVAKHVMGTTYEKDATGHWTKCTTEGCTEKSKVEEHTFKDGESKCSVCGQEKEHVCVLKEVSAKSATCEKTGNIAHYKCKECSKLYEDKDGKKEITEEKVIIAKTEHKNTWYITKEATKDKVGELKGKCSVCGTSTKMDLEKLGTSGKLTVGSDDDNEFDAELATEDAYMLVELTTDEVKEINNGMGLNILLSIEDLDEDITSSDKKKMEEKMDDDYKLIKYLDITLTKQLLDDDKVKESDEVDETSEELEIILEIPEKMQGKDTYKVLRLHNGKVEILDAEYDKDDKTIKFETDQFSTYAVVYEDKDAAKEDSKADSTTGTVMPDAGDNNIIFLWATMAMISAFGLSVMLQKKKED